MGVGDGVDIQPFAQPDHTTYLGAELSAGAALGPIANIGGELKYGQYGNPYEDDLRCFKGGGALEGSFVGVEAAVDLDGKVTADKLDPTKGRDLRNLFKSRGPSNLINLERKLEAKAVMKACGSVSNLF